MILGQHLLLTLHRFWLALSLSVVVLCCSAGLVIAQEAETPPTSLDRVIDQPDQPLYSPFTARYLLDEIRLLRTMVERTRAELIERQVTREYEVAREAAAYARNAVELFFFIIVGVTTLLVFLGWTSFRDVRSRVQIIAEGKVEDLIQGYSGRLDDIEKELHSKTKKLTAAQKEIDQTNEVHSLWLRAAQENGPAGKIAIYDEILRLRPEDVEARTFKADAALEVGEIEWAFSLANEALDLDPENGHALYQRACANACRDAPDDALTDLETAVAVSESYREQAAKDPAFDSLNGQQRFQDIVREAYLPT